MNRTADARELTRGQAVVLGTATLAMVVVGGFGAWGTYTNAVSAFHRQATAAGVVAAGEGLTLILALVMLGRTMLGMAAPAVVRGGMWLAPLSASCIGLSIASNPREAAVYAATPLAMSGAAEGLGFIARSIVVYRTGVDAETMRRNADAARQLAYNRAVADGHPDERKQKSAVRRYWRLARYVGVGDAELGAGLVDVQRVRVREGADAALAGMYGVAPAAVEQAPARPPSHSAHEMIRRKFAEMDVDAAVRVARAAHPHMPPAQLAALLGSYGVIVDAIRVAFVARQSAGHDAERREDRVTRQESRQTARQRAWKRVIADLRRIEFSTVPTGRHAPVVYFLHNGDRVKIGTSTNLRKRVEQLSLRCPDLILAVEGGRSVERAFHKQFAEQRVGSTEWFHLQDDLDRWVQEARRDLPAVPWSPYEEPEPETQMTVERADDDRPEAAPSTPQLVMPPIAELEPAPFQWEDVGACVGTAEVTTALPAADPRQMVTATVMVTPSELRRRARRLNREAVRSSGRPVTIKTLQDELGLSRREATELRREIVDGSRS